MDVHPFIWSVGPAPTFGTTATADGPAPPGFASQPPPHYGHMRGPASGMPFSAGPVDHGLPSIADWVMGACGPEGAFSFGKSGGNPVPATGGPPAPGGLSDGELRGLVQRFFEYAPVVTARRAQGPSDPRRSYTAR
jgi:hypothetical protein